MPVSLTKRASLLQVSCLPLQYFSFSGGKAAKALRLVRLAKMLRLAKMKRIIGARLGSRYGLTSEIFGFTMLFAAICYTAHLLTCLWYVVGTGAAASSLVGGVQVEQTGWAQVEYCCAADESPAECSGQCEDDQLSNITVGERYVTSIYYVFNALEHATLSSERGFAVCAELTIGLIFGSMAGLMSSVMISIRGNAAEINLRLRELKVWLGRKHLPEEQQEKIMDYFHSSWMANRQINYGELISQMPPQMASEVTTRLYSNFLVQIPLFRGLSAEIIAALCREVVPMLVVKEQIIMAEGAPGREMFMLLKGEVEMSQDGCRLGFLGEGAFFGERAVLSEASGSETRVRTVRAVTTCELCFLTKEKLATLRGRYAELSARCIRFSRAGTKMTARQKEKLNLHMESMTKHVELFKAATQKQPASGSPAEDEMHQRKKLARQASTSEMNKSSDWNVDDTRASRSVSSEASPRFRADSSGAESTAMAKEMRALRQRVEELGGGLAEIKGLLRAGGWASVPTGSAFRTP